MAQDFSILTLQAIAAGSLYIKHIDPPDIITGKYRFIGRHARNRQKIDLLIVETWSEDAPVFINIWHQDDVEDGVIFEIRFMKVDGVLRVLDIKIVSE
jgi:hypothetical protein